MAMKMQRNWGNCFTLIPGHRQVGKGRLEVHPDDPRETRPRGTTSKVRDPNGKAEVLTILEFRGAIATPPKVPIETDHVNWQH